MSAAELWRAIPWDRRAPPGAPYSPSYIAPGQTGGRFDLHDRPPVLYLAESAAHALGELLQAFRSRRISRAHLRRHGHGLAVVAVRVATGLTERIPDLTDDATLARLGVRADDLAGDRLGVSQSVARRLHAAGDAGFRWWSTLTGAWRTTVLFPDRCAATDLAWQEPAAVRLDSPALAAAARVLGIQLP